MQPRKRNNVTTEQDDVSPALEWFGVSMHVDLAFAHLYSVEESASDPNSTEIRYQSSKRSAAETSEVTGDLCVRIDELGLGKKSVSNANRI